MERKRTSDSDGRCSYIPNIADKAMLGVNSAHFTLARGGLLGVLAHGRTATKIELIGSSETIREMR